MTFHIGKSVIDALPYNHGDEVGRFRQAKLAHHRRLVSAGIPTGGKPQIGDRNDLLGFRRHCPCRYHDRASICAVRRSRGSGNLLFVNRLSNQFEPE